MNENPAVQLTQQLVRMQTTPERGQQPAADLLADRLDAAGFTVTMHPCSGGSNVVAQLGDPDAAALCFSGHLDTVPVVEESWSQDPFGGTLSRGKLWGRGASDMKAGAAAIVQAAVLWAAASPRSSVPLTLILTAEEELGCLGAASLVEDGSALHPVSSLVIAEPTSNRPLLGHRGAVWLDVAAQGRSCHASTPHLGENAIDKLIDCLQAIRAWTKQHPSSHQVLGDRTLSVGRIEGGLLRNIVPDRAGAQLDFRVSDARDVSGLAEALAAELAGLGEVSTALALPPVFSEQADPFVREVLDVARLHVEEPLDSAAARFFTDASILTPALGAPPTVIWGPGSADLAHVVDEWCSVAEIVTAVEAYGDLIERHALATEALPRQ